MSDEPLVRLEGVEKVFQSGEMVTRALTGVRLAIEAGEYVSVAGPSGCGKSTLLSLIGLLDTPSAGRYLPAGRPVAALGATRRAAVRNREIGFIFQSFNLIGDLTALQNVELPLKYRGAGRGERRRAAGEALERVGMSARGDEFPGHLSGGEQQRVAVARAIVARPALLLADEPTGNLDSANGEAVMALLGELHGEGATIVLVTHDPRYAVLARREVDLFDGRVVRDQPRGAPGTVEHA